MKILILTLLFSSLSAFAEPKCEQLKTPNDVLKCVVNSHAAVQVGKAKVNEVSLGIDVASQRPNPELELEGTDQVGPGWNSEITLLHTFELGGKRSARMHVAERERDMSQADLLSRKESIAVQTVSDLYRLRQIDHEKSIVEEIIHTFESITKQYSKAGRLSPEDKMSVSVFKMALEENKLKKNSLVNEKEGILARIEADVGKKISITQTLLPKIKRSWPNLTKSALSGSQILKAKAEVELSSANYNLEKSESWPNLSIGPKVEIENAGGTETRFGVALSIPIPLFQANGGGRAKSLAGVRRSKVQLKYAKTRLERQKEYLHDVYRRVAARISKTLSNKQVTLKHKNLHKMIKRGVVSAPIVIELHRQIMDYYEKLHDQELEGVVAQWKIAALEGRILKETLQ